MSDRAEVAYAVGAFRHMCKGLGLRPIRLSVSLETQHPDGGLEWSAVACAGRADWAGPDSEIAGHGGSPLQACADLMMRASAAERAANDV